MQDFDGDDDANDGNDEEEYEEANPALLACRSCRGDSLIRVAKTTGPVRQLTPQTVADSCSPSFDVLLNFGSLSLDDIDGFILLLNKDTHLTF